MKKIVRTLGITLSLLVLISCDNGGDGEDNSLPEVNPNTLAGTYKVSIAMVDTAVDSNKDGFSSQDLLLEGYNACGFDDGIEITEKTFSIIRKGASCKADEKNEVYDYTYDSTTKDLNLYLNGKLVETLKKAYIANNNNVKELMYDRYDSVLKQTIYLKFTKV